jgi:hypothetical protein
MTAGGMRADEALALVPEDGWQRLSCADGSKGPRPYDWALIGTAVTAACPGERRSGRTSGGGSAAVHPVPGAAESAQERCRGR